MAPRKTKRKLNSGGPSTQAKKSKLTHPPNSKPLLETPKPPLGAAYVNLENRLHDPPRREEEDRPWFLYDLVQPVPMFRKAPPGTDSNNKNYRAVVDVDEGDDPGELTETPGINCRPVAVPGYV
jgi:hypothetical protein